MHYNESNAHPLLCMNPRHTEPVLLDDLDASGMSEHSRSAAPHAVR